MNRFMMYLLSSVLFFYNIHPYSQIFTKVTQGPFVNNLAASRSVSFIDYLNNGSLDLYVSNGKRFGQRNFLYNNNGGTFTRVLNIPPVMDSLPYDGASWADFDNDGNIDLCVVTWYDSTNMLYRNNGGGSFTFLSSSPIVTDRGFSETCSWGDYNNDGLVDLFVTNSNGIGNWTNRLYKNSGGGNFVRIDTGAISLDLNYNSRGINWVDINGDGKPDIYICNESGENNLMYKNNGNGYFTKLTNTATLTKSDSWSACWGDYDNDGDLDVFVTNRGGKNLLFRNEGNFNFTRILNDSIVNDVGEFTCGGWGDFDNDGDLDLFVTQAYTSPNIPLKNFLYKNMLMETGAPTFQKISGEDIVNDAGYSYGFSWADWNADGSLDLFTARTYNENQNNAAYLNNGNTNKWIEIKLTGNPSNRSGIGAKVRVKAIINGNPVWQMREVTAQSGYCSENLDLHFGLGNAASIDSIKVEWPSGTNEYYHNITPNRIIRIIEGTGIIGIKLNSTEVPERFTLKQNYPNPFNPTTIIGLEIPKEGFVSLKVFDVTGREIKNLVSQNIKPGKYSIDYNVLSLPSGVYFYRLDTENFSDTKKMVVLK